MIYLYFAFQSTLIVELASPYKGLTLRLTSCSVS